MSTNVEHDLELLVGEMEAPACESAGHEIQPQAHDHGTATHYVRVGCVDCDTSAVKAYCQRFVDFIASGARLICPDCGGDAAEATVLQAIKNQAA